MSRKQLDPLRPLTDEERSHLCKLARAAAAPAAQVARAKALLAVAVGQSYTAAARAAGRKSGDAVAHLVSRFHIEGLAALAPKPTPGPAAKYTPARREQVLAAARRTPDPATDGCASWSLTMMQLHLHSLGGGLAHISTVTSWTILREAGFRWQRSHERRQRVGGSATYIKNYSDKADASSNGYISA